MPLGGFAPMPLRLGGPAEESFASPEQFARLTADLLAMKRIAPFARWTYTQTGAGATDYTVDYFAGQHGVGLTYAPETITVNGTGDISFQWASQVFADEYGYEWPVRFRSWQCSAAYNASFPTVKAHGELIARGIRVRIVDAGGTARNGQVSVRLR